MVDEYKSYIHLIKQLPRLTTTTGSSGMRAPLSHQSLHKSTFWGNGLPEGKYYDRKGSVPGPHQMSFPTVVDKTCNMPPPMDLMGW